VENVARNLDCLYFTDSGFLNGEILGFNLPFPKKADTIEVTNESSISKPLGSVFVVDLEANIIKPLALRCLAYPTGLALSAEENVL